MFFFAHLTLFFRPVNKEELFNLRHASARNVIERIFGVVKRRFRILLISPEYSIDIQARIPTALCALHNYIRAHDPDEGPLPHIPVVNDNHHDTFPAPPGHADTDNSGAAPIHTNTNNLRDQIATQMWEDYQNYLYERDLMDVDQFLESDEEAASDDEQYAELENDADNDDAI